MKAKEKSYTLEDWIKNFGEQHKITNIRYLQNCCANSLLPLAKRSTFGSLPEGWKAKRVPYGNKGNRYRWLIIDERSSARSINKDDILEKAVIRDKQVITGEKRRRLALEREKIVLEMLNKINNREITFETLAVQLGVTPSGAFRIYKRVKNKHSTERKTVVTSSTVIKKK